MICRHSRFARFMPQVQAWCDFRCGLLGHTLSESSGYCCVCGRWQMDHFLDMQVRALAARIDEWAMADALASLAEYQHTQIGAPIVKHLSPYLAAERDALQ